MPKITRLSQLDLNKTYSYADYITWQFDEMVELIKGKISLMSPAPNLNHQKIFQYPVFQNGEYQHLSLLLLILLMDNEFSIFFYQFNFLHEIAFQMNAIKYRIV